jgi:hypothetical protein
MSRRTYTGYALVVVGLGVAASSFRLGGATERACPGIDSVIYDWFGVYPSEARIVSVDLLAASIEWYDGCNWHTQSLLPVYVGALVVLAGVVVLSRAPDADVDD